MKIEWDSMTLTIIVQHYFPSLPFTPWAYRIRLIRLSKYLTLNRWRGAVTFGTKDIRSSISYGVEEEEQEEEEKKVGQKDSNINTVINNENKNKNNNINVSV